MSNEEFEMFFSIWRRIFEKYREAQKQEWIEKPLSYALYQVWKEQDSKERRGECHEICNCKHL